MIGKKVKFAKIKLIWGLIGIKQKEVFLRLIDKRQYRGQSGDMSHGVVDIQ